MTEAHAEGMPVETDQSADRSDPVALEARLAAARLRRSSVLAARSGAAEDARPPAPAAEGVAPPRPAALAWLARLPRPSVSARAAGLAGFAAGLGTALLLGLLVPSSARPPAAGPATAAPATLAASPAQAPAQHPAPMPAPPVAVAVLPPVPRPEPRPAAHPVAPAAATAVQSARNAPRAVTPPQAVRMIVRDLNAATVGRTAAALGIRERVAVPGVPLAVTLDRRGLRVHERRLRGGRNR